MKKLLTQLAVALLLLVPTLASANFLTSLQAYYKFSESSGNPVDSSGNGNTLTNTNIATFPAGILDNSGGLNGTTQYFTAVDSTSLSVLSDFSISVWVFPTLSIAQDTRYVIANKEGSYVISYDRNKTADGAVSQITIQFNATGANVGMIGGAYSSTNTAGDLLTANAWSHLVFTREKSSGNMAIYINGARNNTLTNSAGTAITDTANALEVGRGATVYTNNAYYVVKFWQGRIDELSIYSRALDQQDVKMLYKAGVGCQYAFINCDIPFFGTWDF